MKKNFVILLSLFLVFCDVYGQEDSPYTKSDGKAEKTLEEKMIMEKIGKLLTDTSFMFNATDMIVRGEGNVNLGYNCDVQVKNEIVKSYLPFIGKAYYVSNDLDSKNSGFDFTLPIQHYQFKKSKSGYVAVLKVKNGTDLLNYNFYITKTGLATLTVASSRRQSISYYGSISELN
jgi:hypothetical protein